MPDPAGVNPGLLHGQPVPPDLGLLNPETQAKQIVVGRKEGDVTYKGTPIPLPAAFTAYPLPENAAAELAEDLSAFLRDFIQVQFSCQHSGKVCAQMQIVCHEKKMSAAIASPSPCGARECPYFVPKDSENVLSQFLKSHLLAKVVSYAVCGDVSDAGFFSQNMTFSQLAHAGTVIYAQNFTVENLPGDTAKNVMSLLRLLGFGKAVEPEEAQETPRGPEPVTRD